MTCENAGTCCFRADIRHDKFYTRRDTNATTQRNMTADEDNKKDFVREGHTLAISTRLRANNIWLRDYGDASDQNKKNKDDSPTATR